jgi:hypothetical protein
MAPYTELAKFVPKCVHHQEIRSYTSSSNSTAYSCCCR